MKNRALGLEWEGEAICFEMHKLSTLREFSDAFYGIKCVWLHICTACLEAYLPPFLPRLFMGCLLSLTGTALSKTRKLILNFRR